MARQRSTTKRRAVLTIACLAFLPLLSACTQEPTVRHFTFDEVRDATGMGEYSVGRTAVGTATEEAGAPMEGKYVVSIQLTSTGSRSVTAHPTAASPSLMPARNWPVHQAAVHVEASKE